MKMQPYIGSYIKGDLGGVKVSNPSLRSYYGDKIMPREGFSKGTMPKRNKKNFRPTKSGAGMTQAGVKAYRRLNPGSKLKTAVTGKVKPGSKAAKTHENHTAQESLAK